MDRAMSERDKLSLKMNLLLNCKIYDWSREKFEVEFLAQFPPVDKETIDQLYSMAQRM